MPIRSTDCSSPRLGIEQFVLVTQDRQILPYGVPLIGVS